MVKFLYLRNFSNITIRKLTNQRIKLFMIPIHFLLTNLYFFISQTNHYYLVKYDEIY